MHLFEITSGACMRLYALGDQQGRCPLHEFGEGLTGKHAKQWDRMLALMADAAGKGVHGLPGERFKKMRGFADIYELKTGDLRVICFFDEGSMLICSHGMIKKGKAAQDREAERAESRRKAYFEAKKRGDVVIVLRGV